VHLSEKAVDPPGEARSDLDIFIDYAHRVGLKDKDGQPLVKWNDPEGAFEGWKECSAGRPCDYTGLTYDKLRGPSGIPWPVNAEHPDGTDRLYADAVFPSDTDHCETYGHDLATGGAVSETEHRAQAPDGRAFLKGAPYSRPHEEPTGDFPLRYTTGRTVYHFHTRTKTGRSRDLDRAAPDAWVELSGEDAGERGIEEGDWVRVESPRGSIEVRARIGQVMPGADFAPFHYGRWDPATLGGVDDADHRTANELTMTVWDPVSKQPIFKTAACQVTRVRAGDGPAPAPTTGASAPADRGTGPGRRPRPTRGGGPTTSSVLDETPAYPLDPAQGGR
jgi:anaerobic selenocysteine-containing dehydrogenase